MQYANLLSNSGGTLRILTSSGQSDLVPIYEKSIMESSFNIFKTDGVSYMPMYFKACNASHEHAITHTKYDISRIYDCHRFLAGPPKDPNSSFEMNHAP